VTRDTLLAHRRDELIALILAQLGPIEALMAQVRLLSARAAKLGGQLNASGKTPDNSQLPPSEGQKPNLPQPAKKPWPGRPGVTRALAEHPYRVIEARLAACPRSAHTLIPADQAEIHAYAHIELPPIRPIVTRINRHRSVSPAAASATPQRCCRGSSHRH